MKKTTELAIGNEVQVLIKTFAGRNWIAAKVEGFSTWNEPCVRLLQPTLCNGNYRLIKNPRLIRESKN